MIRDMRLRALIGFVWGLALFHLIGWSLKFVLSPAARDSAAVSQVVLKGTMIIVALLIWRLTGRAWSEMGWRRASLWSRWQGGWYSLAAISMMAASVILILVGVRHPIAAQLGFLQVVLLVWVLSSLSEEVYVRGLVQSWITEGVPNTGGDAPGGPAVLASALLFAAMHVSLMRSSMGPGGGLVIVGATFAIGLACAVLRSRSGSLWPAIACHVLGNVAGVPGGILGVILYRLLFGRLPEFVSGG